MPDDYHDVNSNFRVVCIWGFFLYIILFVASVYFTLTARNVSYNPIIITGLVMLWLAHFLTMMIMRWRHAGKVCSGDYLDEPNRYSLFDAKEPYLHNAGSFLYYTIISQFMLVIGSFSGFFIMIGMSEFDPKDH